MAALPVAIPIHTPAQLQVGFCAAGHQAMEEVDRLERSREERLNSGKISQVAARGCHAVCMLQN